MVTLEGVVEGDDEGMGHELEDVALRFGVLRVLGVAYYSCLEMKQ